MLEVVANVVVDVRGDVGCQRSRGHVGDVGTGERRRDGDIDGFADLVVRSTVVDDDRVSVVQRKQFVAVGGLDRRAGVDQDDERELLAVTVSEPEASR